MFKKVKKWLGIEGVKVELILPEKIKEADGVINGKIRFSSMNDQVVDAVRVIMVERFSRGKKKEKLTDEYRLGEITLNKEIIISKEHPVEMEFSLPFELIRSEMDELENRNIFFSGLVKVAKKLRGVNSEYFVEVEAKAKGTALSPFDKQSIQLE